MSDEIAKVEAMSDSEKLTFIALGMAELLSFMGHASKVAAQMAGHPMFSAMLPPDVRKNLTKK